MSDASQVGHGVGMAKAATAADAFDPVFTGWNRVAYGFGIQHAGKVPTLLTAAVVMIALGILCAKLLRQTRPADAAAT